MSRSAWLGLFLAALVFTLVMAWLPHPPSVPGNPNDKIQHIAAFTCLSLLGAMAFPAFPLARLGERLSFLGAIIEVVQAIPALHRDCDIRDWIADTLAVVVALFVVGALRRSRTRRSREVKQSVEAIG
jgi:peptidoglycan/LPS O-acetylase OafA/YrhL